MKDMTGLGILGIAALGIWAISSKKIKVPGITPTTPTTPSIPRVSVVPAKPVPPQPTGVIKTAMTEAASIPLDVWQALTQQQLQGLPVIQQTGLVNNWQALKLLLS